MKSMSNMVINPTGRQFTMNNCSIAYWVNGKIKKLYVFGDSIDFMKQLGILEKKMEKNVDINNSLMSTIQMYNNAYDESNIIHDDGDGDEQVKKNISSLQKIDFDGFNNRRWDIIGKLFDENVASIFSGDTLNPVKGRDHNLSFMKKSLEYAPDTHVKHVIQFGSENLTCTYLIVSGTFTKPMIATDGSTIQPTNEKFYINYCSIERWKDNKLITSYIFTDTADMMKQFKTSKL
jgi:hypothetical protein